MRTYDNLSVCHLTHEQAAKTCGPYFFTVLNHQMAHTAFRSRQHFDAWLNLRGLKVKDNIDEHGAYSEIVGEYREDMRMGSQKELESIDGHFTRRLQNGDYVDCVITKDADGIYTEHVLNPNVRDRRTYDYAESRRIFG